MGMEQRLKNVEAFLAEGKYPEKYTSNQRLSLRRYATKFSLREGQLFYGKRRVIHSLKEAKSLFLEFHTSAMGGHSGTIKTRTALCSRFYWQGMSIQIDKWVLECDRCQRTGQSLAATQPLQCIKVSAVWELVGIDLTGPLPKTADGFQYILTATDYFSKWVEAFPLKTKTASEVAKCLCALVYRHGCPKRILSDQGREFVNELNNGLCALLGIGRSVTAAYHPQTNGLDEKTNDNIKRALTKLVNDQQNNWDVFLDAALFSLRSKVHTTTKHSPFLLMYGREAVFPSELPVNMPLSKILLPEEGTCQTFLEKKQLAMETVSKKTSDNITKSQEKQKTAYEKRARKKYKNVVYCEGQEILVYNMRKRGRKGGRIEPDFHGPYVIKEIVGKQVILSNSEGVTLKTKYSIDHIKQYRRSNDNEDHILRIHKTPLDNKHSKCPDLPVLSEELHHFPERPSVLKFAPPREPSQDSSSKEPNTDDRVNLLWAAKDQGKVEAVVGPYNLHDASFRTLQGTNWLADDIIDAYIHILLEKQQEPMHHLNATVAGSLFGGRFQPLAKMKFPEKDNWICPVNVGAHWILVIVNMPKRTLLLVDPLGKEDYYARKIQRNWRNFLRMAGREVPAEKWKTKILPHNNQQDGTSCGILILKFAESLIKEGDITTVETNPAEVLKARLEIASRLLTFGCPQTNAVNKVY